ncbi:glycoside hydrolase family 16 protein [Curvularia clavata]|uniref:Crh-like protein n=1 Tax=Curvularia clavata TaxID=95742 RepID=A0A9Q8Z803_CURCL|nr:glycoside hydrolase family 16 protein [Curvularia clavata]
MRFSTYTTASVLAALASAQTFTDCNPMEKTCPNDPAMPQTWETDFTAGKDAIKGWKQTAGELTYGPDGAAFTVAKKGDAPTIGSEAYLHFGYVEVVMKAAPGVGIVSSIVLQSDNLDEVDWEWIGGVDSRVQMNYFGKGNTTTFDRMIEGDVANNQNDFHKYALNWTSESLTWIIDDKPVRTLNFADANGGKNFPQTPCNVRLGNWPGGDSENEGTRQWAGGNVTYANAPFTMTVKSVKVTNYSPGKEYQWTDKTGDFKSIKVIDAGNKDGAPVNNLPIKPTNGTQSGIEAGVDTPAASGSPAQGGSSGDKATPCDCGTAYVTVTAAPPPASNAPPATFTSSYSAIPLESAKSKLSSAIEQTTGLAIDTRSAPGIPTPTAPTGAIPQPQLNGTSSAAPPEFTGAASHVKAGGLIGAVLGAVVLAL